MERLVVYAKASDRPGLLTEIIERLSHRGVNIVTTLGYVDDNTAHLLLVLDSPLAGEEIEELLSDIVDARVAPLGPAAAELLAEFIDNRPGLASILEMHLDPPDIHDMILRLDPERRQRIYKVLSPTTLARILAIADEDLVNEIATTLDLNSLVRAISSLGPDEAVDVLQKLPEALRRQVLRLLPRNLVESISRLMEFPPETVGGVMTTSIPVLHEDERVEEALAILKRGDYDIRDTIVVVSHDGKLVGMVTVDTLLRERPDRKLGEIAVKPHVTIGPLADREEAAKLMLRYSINRLPVVDEQGRFLGIVAIEDMAEVLAEEAAEDIALLGGAARLRERYLTARVVDIVRSRVIWLILIYVIQSVTANILKAYEDLISRIAIVAAFIPLIMDTGGNVGSQASSTIIRALALGEISEYSLRDILVVIAKETATATIVGAIMGVLGFTFSMLVAGEIRIAVAVATTLFTVVLFADLVGSFLPIVARRLGFDPATVSAPLVTTIVDISVAAIYMGLAASLILPQT